MEDKNDVILARDPYQPIDDRFAPQPVTELIHDAWVVTLNCQQHDNHQFAFFHSWRDDGDLSLDGADPAESLDPPQACGRRESNLF